MVRHGMVYDVRSMGQRCNANEHELPVVGRTWEEGKGDGYKLQPGKKNATAKEMKANMERWRNEKMGRGKMIQEMEK